jgi:hypothetical protein
VTAVPEDQRRLHELAEDAYAYIGAKPWQTTLDTPEYFLKHADDVGHAIGGMATRVRMGDEFDRCVRDVKSWFAAHGRHAFFWMIGPSATPSDLRERLLSQGASPLTGFEPAWCMALEREPPAVVDAFEIRRLETLAELEQRADLSANAFGWSAAYLSSAKLLLREHWETIDPAQNESFGVFEEGRLIAFGTSAYTPALVFLDGGVTSPAARSRGAYRALVRARWDEAVRRETPTLVAHAGEMSAPILERLGFQTICELHALQDSC